MPRGICRNGKCSMNQIGYITPIAQLFVALAAFVLSCIALFMNARLARAQLYLELRKRFSEINSQLPRIRPDTKDYHDSAWLPTPTSDPSYFPPIEKYWYHTFDEWFIARTLQPWPFRPLWKLFIGRAIYEGLKNVPIRYVLNLMIKLNRTSFSGHSVHFVRDLTAVWNKYKDRGAKGIFDFENPPI